MTNKISFSIRFKEDVEDAFQFYKKINPLLAKRLKLCVKAGISSIKETPQFAIRYDEIRCLPISTFPYMIH